MRFLLPASAALSLVAAGLYAQNTSPEEVALPSASISTRDQLEAMIEAPAPEVNAEASKADLPEGFVLPEILAAVAAERAALGVRAQAIAQREAEVAFAAAALSEQQAQLGALKAELENLLNQAEANHTADVQRLVSIYRNMKPVEAAQILSTSDLEVSVLVLAAMPERDSGPIFAQMEQVRAQAISKIILERSRLPGDQKLVNLRINE